MSADTPTDAYFRKVGSARPNALLYSNGVGAVVDLPHISVVVRGLDAWDYRQANVNELTEPRLLRRVRQILGPHIQQLRPAPRRVAFNNSDEDIANRVGVPVTPFPRWMRCTACYRLGALNSSGTGGTFVFENRNKNRPDEAKFVHTACKFKVAKGPAPVAVPARFVTACRKGHLDEFPWVEYTHKAKSCPKRGDGQLRLLDPGGQSGAMIQIRCSCGASRSMRDALGHHRKRSSTALPACRGRHPHLGVFDGPCDEPIRAMVLGASNQWFGLLASSLYVPELASAVALLVEKYWAKLEPIPTMEFLPYALQNVPELVELRAYDDNLVWAEITARKDAKAPEGEDEIDLTAREYEALYEPSKAQRNDDFTADVLGSAVGWEGLVDRVVRVSRLRETKALLGFTRVDAPDWGEPDAAKRAPLAAGQVDWVPAATTHGEGIFIALNTHLVKQWEDSVENTKHMARLRAAHHRWRDNRELPGPHAGHWPGDRYLLLHTLSHVLVREIALECGYSSASIAERLYANATRDEAGILLYTAAADSEGTLGGLVRLSDPVELDRVFRAAFANARRCSSDPICSDHLPLETEDTLHGAACHACLFASETTCQRGNRFLDRAVLVPITSDAEEIAVSGLFTVPGW